VQGYRSVMRLYTGVQVSNETIYREYRLVMRLYTGVLVLSQCAGVQVSNEAIYRGTG
jgi:hypothetical protein